MTLPLQLERSLGRFDHHIREMLAAEIPEIVFQGREGQKGGLAAVIVKGDRRQHDLVKLGGRGGAARCFHVGIDAQRQHQRGRREQVGSQPVFQRPPGIKCLYLLRGELAVGEGQARGFQHGIHKALKAHFRLLSGKLLGHVVANLAEALDTDEKQKM